MTHSDKFMAELHLLCYFALFSSDDMKALLNNRLPYEDLRFYNHRIWHALHGVLISAANISKILWPIPDYAVRGQRLRQEPGVSDDSPLHSRSLRNHFEHVDERIEEWTGPRVDLNIGPAEDRAGGRRPFRHFDPWSGVVLFAGKRYDLLPIENAILRLRQRLDELDPYP